MVEYTLINVISFVFGCIFLYAGFRMVKRGREDVVLFFMMAGVGAGFIVVALYPNFFELVAALIGLEWKGRAILVVSSLVQFVLIMYLLHRTNQLYTKVSTLNEELSLLGTTVDEREAEDAEHADDD